jgi:hypothetical protein
MTKPQHSPPRFTCHGRGRGWLRPPAQWSTGPVRAARPQVLLEYGVGHDARAGVRQPDTTVASSSIGGRAWLLQANQRGHALMQGGLEPDPQKSVVPFVPCRSEQLASVLEPDRSKLESSVPAAAHDALDSATLRRTPTVCL